MKCVLLLLPFIAACACDGEIANPAPAVPDPSSIADSAVAPAEWISSQGYIDRSYGAYGGGYDGRAVDGYKDGGVRDGAYRDGGVRDGGYRDSGVKDGGYADGAYKNDGKIDGDYPNDIRQGNYKDYIFDGQDYHMFFIPRLVGRQGLGFQKRNFFSTAFRWPITPEILQPIGYRPTVKELYFEPLPKYNYNTNNSN